MLKVTVDDSLGRHVGQRQRGEGWILRGVLGEGRRANHEQIRHVPVLEISIDDNGVGFHFSGAYTLDELDLLRMGPVSLKRRARSLGADLLLESRPGHGAGLKMKIPI